MKKKLPIFATSEGRSEYLAAYEAMFTLWKVPYDGMDVQTGFGSTHVNISGPREGPPLVLLHGAGLSSTAWYANMAAFSTNHRVYAVDVIGDAGKSVADILMEKRSDYAQWLRELLDGLKIDKASFVGHSYGGWLALNMALAYPHRLSKIVLLAPAASIYPMSVLMKLGFYLSELKLLRLSARSTFKLIAWKGAVFDETFMHLMETVTRYCVPALMLPTVYTDEELKQIELPTLLLIGAGEKIYHLKKAMERAQRLMPNLKSEIIPNAGHPLIMEQPGIINARILDFLNSGS